MQSYRLGYGKDLGNVDGLSMSAISIAKIATVS